MPALRESSLAIPRIGASVERPVIRRPKYPANDNEVSPLDNGRGGLGAPSDAASGGHMAARRAAAMGTRRNYSRNGGGAT